MAQNKYITVAELAEAFDADLLSGLGTDTTTPGTVNESNAILLNAIERASGEIESKSLKGGRYTKSDLSTLQSSDDWILKGLVATLAMKYLYARRAGEVPSAIATMVSDAEEQADELKDGKSIFDHDASKTAGKISISVIDENTRGRIHMAADSEYFPRRPTQTY